MAGYSTTPLWKKLGLKTGVAAAVLDAPDDYFARLLDDAPQADWGPLQDGVNFIHGFTSTQAGLETLLDSSLNAMARDGTLWVSWPKKASGVPSEITEDDIRTAALPLGLVDVKVCAVDNIWSGLKLVIRKENR